MLRSLRNRLILSHVLPLLVIIPLAGIALIYVLETRVLLPGLSNELEGEASLLAEIAGNQPDIWTNPTIAQSMFQRVSSRLTSRVMLLDSEGRMLASSDPADAGRLNQIINVRGLSQVLNGTIVKNTNYNQSFQGEVIDVMAPVIGADQHVIGVVRMTYRYDTISEDFIRLRYLISGILVFSLILGVGLGSVLALNISVPIQTVTRAIFDLAQGKRSENLPEHGPEEIEVLVHAANVLVERLHDLEAARRQLLANLVHELGRPLGAIHAAIQALIRGAKKDPKLLDELLLGIDNETDLLERLLDDLTHLHDQVLGTLELERKQFDVGEWLTILLRPWQEMAVKKRLHWEVILPPNLPTIDADPDRLGQVIGNLVSNAIKYTPPRGMVSISAGEEGNSVWIQVGDTGPGISKDDQEKIFTPFFRGNKGRRFPQGMGLGLSIARDLIKAHGGYLEVESTPGLGSKFTAWVPKSI